MEQPTIRWHNLSPDDALSEIDSRIDGLSNSEVQKRQEKYGFNELLDRKKIPLFKVFFRQFLSPLIYVLLPAGVISLVSQFFAGEKHYIDAIVVFGVIILNAIIGTFQESQAERAMEALLEMAAPRAKVKRDGNIQTIPAREIVPGDIILFETGDKVPADIRLRESANLRVDESALTGESIPVEKQVSAVPEDAIIAERVDMLFMSTIVTGGRATGLAGLTGMVPGSGKTPP